MVDKMELIKEKIEKACLGQRYPISNMMELGFEQDINESDGFQTVFKNDTIKSIFNHNPMSKKQYVEIQVVE